MVTTLSQLVDMTQGEAIPAWLRNQILAKREEIAASLNSKGEIILVGPNGEQVTVQTKSRAAAASV